MMKQVTISDLQRNAAEVISMTAPQASRITVIR